MTIDASGNDSKQTPVAGDGDGSTVFYIGLDAFSTNEQMEVTLNGLTITGGDSSSYTGGGITFLGNATGTDAYTKLTILNSTISGNHAESEVPAGAVYAGGLSVDITGNGIIDSGLTIRDSTISSNSSTAVGSSLSGGGLAVDASYTMIEIADTVIHGNNSATKGGGGFLRLHESTANIMRSTISNNTSTGTTLVGGASPNKDGGGYLRLPESTAKTNPKVNAEYALAV